MSISSTRMDQHFFGGPVGRCISRNTQTFGSALRDPASGPGVAEAGYEVPGCRKVTDGASGGPVCSPDPEVAKGGLGASAWPAWGLEVVEGGFGLPEWDPNATEGVMGDTKLCSRARKDELTGGHLFLSGNLDVLVVSSNSLAGRLFLSDSPETRSSCSPTSLAGLFNGPAADALVLTCMLSVGT
jgi:hypothetical protein